MMEALSVSAFVVMASTNPALSIRDIKPDGMPDHSQVKTTGKAGGMNSPRRA